MKKKLIVNLCLITINIFLTKDAFSQQPKYIEDSRILRYQKNIYEYLIKQKVLEPGIPFNIESFNLKVQVIKCLEVYLGNSKSNLLLIRFGRSGDHMEAFWGVLS